MRLIDEDLLKRKFRDVNEGMFQLSRVYELIDNTPAIITARTTTEGFLIIDMRSRNTGEWITTERGYECSVCGALHVDDYPFCHMCGADMRKEANNETN